MMGSPGRVILSMKTVFNRVPYGRTTIWKKSKDPEDPFPATVDVGPNKTGIFEDELNASTCCGRSSIFNAASDATEASTPATPEATEP